MRTVVSSNGSPLQVMWLTGKSNQYDCNISQKLFSWIYTIISHVINSENNWWFAFWNITLVLGECCCGSSWSLTPSRYLSCSVTHSILTPYTHRLICTYFAHFYLHLYRWIPPGSCGQEDLAPSSVCTAEGGGHYPGGEWGEGGHLHRPHQNAQAVCQRHPNQLHCPPTGSTTSWGMWGRSSCW